MSFSCQKKEILYRGGIVRFSIPSHWIEEYGKDGGGTFYAPSDEAGTLRLNVLSFFTEKDVSLTYPLSVMRARQHQYNGRVVELPDSRFLFMYILNVNEDGDDLTIFYWEIARMLSPRDYNVAVFNFTIATNQKESNSMLDEISSIEEEIKKVVFWVH